MDQRYKRSRQRDRIYQFLKRTETHPTAEAIFQAVRDTMPSISLGTVYRNLIILSKQGKIKELDFGEGLKRYDAMVKDHYHFYCESCGKVSDIMASPFNDLNDRIQDRFDGKIHSHKLDFSGVCAECTRSVGSEN